MQHNTLYTCLPAQRSIHTNPTGTSLLQAFIKHLQAYYKPSWNRYKLATSLPLLQALLEQLQACYKPSSDIYKLTTRLKPSWNTNKPSWNSYKLAQCLYYKPSWNTSKPSWNSYKLAQISIMLTTSLPEHLNAYRSPIRLLL